MAMLFAHLVLIAFRGSAYLLPVTMLLALLLLATVAFVQHSRTKAMASSLSHLASLQRKGVEQEMVLKAMRLATWKLDTASKTITYDSDFRQIPELYLSRPGMSVDVPLELIAPDDRERVGRAFQDICEGRIEDFHEQYQLRLPNTDRTIWEESYATVAERSVDGKPVSVVGTSACIDDKKRMEQELVTARNKAEESDLLKSAFIANMSHEVRTPLNAIVGFSDILSSITDEQERQSVIAIIKENNQKLLRIFEDMMNMSVAESGGESISPADFDIVETIMAVVAVSSETNKNSNVVVKADLPMKSLVIHSDPTRVRHIIEHYVENALKFTDEGSVTITLLDEGATVCVSVSDTGCGIPEADQERVFNRFVKLNTFVQGAGLGLSVCRSYAYSLGGKVGVDSKVGVGSRFWLDLPKTI